MGDMRHAVVIGDNLQKIVDFLYVINASKIERVTILTIGLPGKDIHSIGAILHSNKNLYSLCVAGINSEYLPSKYDKCVIISIMGNEVPDIADLQYMCKE